MKNIREVTYSKLTNDRYRLNYHIMGKSGWINDPNGFCFFKGYYHIFYQFHPQSSKWGSMHWGHARSKDLVYWEELPIALFPGDAEDKDGCFSGSAIVKDNRLYLMYTGHHVTDVENDIYWQNQNLAFSDDGINFEKYSGNPVISEPPADNDIDFRDPKVWFENGKYNVVIGSKNKDGLGRVLLYKSEDLKNWDYKGVVETARTADSEGFVWECPDLFNLDGTDFLLMSPQGMKSQGLKYRNHFQTGYISGEYDLENNKFNHDEFKELDYGHDIYATQTLLAPDGRRLLFAWMNMWESEMPEQEDGWAGALTFPRELKQKNNKILMQPVREIANLRKKVLLNLTKADDKNTVFEADTRCMEYLASFNNDDVNITISNKEQTLLELKYDATNRKIVLNKYNDDLSREAEVNVDDKIDIHILLDNSSAEIFANNGEACFSERIYNTENITIETVSKSSDYDIKIYKLDGEE